MLKTGLLIPCHNCLVLGACKSKKVIVCNLLHRWYGDSIHCLREGRLEEWQSQWDKITKWFPNCVGIRIE